MNGLNSLSQDTFLQNITGALKQDTCPPVQRPFTAAVPSAAPSSPSSSPSSSSSPSADLAEIRRTIEGLASAVAGFTVWKQQAEASLVAATASAAEVEVLREEQFQLERAVAGLLALRVEDAAEAAARPPASKEEVAVLAAAVAGCCSQMAALREAQERLAAEVEGRVGAAARELSALAVRGSRASATRAVRVSPVACGLGPAAEMEKSHKLLGELVENLADSCAGASGSGSSGKGKAAVVAAARAGGSK